MFQTLPMAEVSIPKELNPGDMRVWKFVMHSLSTSWLYTVCSDMENPRRTMMLIDSPMQYVAMFCTPRNRFTVHELHLVSPAWMNKMGTWRMEAVREMWLATDAEGDDAGYRFVLADGRSYVCDYGGHLRNDLRESEVLLFPKVDHVQ